MPGSRCIAPGVCTVPLAFHVTSPATAAALKSNGAGPNTPCFDIAERTRHPTLAAEGSSYCALSVALRLRRAAARNRLGGIPVHRMKAWVKLAVSA